MTKPSISTFTFTGKEGDTITQNVSVPCLHFKPIHGRVLGPDGNTAAGATVYLIPTENNFFGQDKPSVITDAKGEFTLEGSSLVLLASSGTMGTPKETALPLGGDVTLELEAGVIAMVSGLVTTNSGDPIPGVQVNLYQSYTERHAFNAPVATTDADGRYTITPVFPGKQYWIQTQGPTGYGNGYLSGSALAAGEKANAKEIVLQKVDSFVAGKVVDEKGHPLAGIDVGINSLHTPYQNLTTDQDGKFRFVAIDGDNVTLYCYDRQGGNASAVVTVAGQSDVVLVLKQAKP